MKFVAQVHEDPVKVLCWSQTHWVLSEEGTHVAWQAWQLVEEEHCVQCWIGQGIHCPPLSNCPCGQVQAAPFCIYPEGHTQLAPPTAGTSGAWQVLHELSVWHRVQNWIGQT